MWVLLYVGVRIATQTLIPMCKTMRRNVGRNLQISKTLTFNDVMAVSTVKRNYETIENEPRKTESAEFSFIKSVPHCLTVKEKCLPMIRHNLKPVF
jgi:hypothetical protein